MNLLVASASVLYPFVVYLAFASGTPLVAMALLGLTLAIKSFAVARTRGPSVTAARAISLTVLIAVIALGVYLPSSSLFYPVAVSAILLAIFASSLVYPPTIIERIARATHGELPPEARAYCRKVCVAWILFLAINLLIALDSTRRTLEWWTLYNGLLSYIGIGTLLLVEYLIRRRVMRRAGAALILLVALSSGLATPLTAEQPFTTDLLSSQLRTPQPFRASFTERRHVSVLSAPLESKGELECLPDRGLVWKVTSPVSTTSVITPSGVTVVEESGARREISDQTGISETLLSLMSGDFRRAHEDFTISLVGSPQEWTLTLTPKDTLVTQVVERIIVTGRDRPTALEVVHANSDRIVTTFSAPIPLSSSEVSKTEATLNGAS